MRHAPLLVLLLIGCDGSGAGTDAGPGATDAGARADAGPRLPLDYDDDASWLCRPGMVGDECLGADLTATEFLPDGSTQTVEHVVATDPAYDCFYVYPTVAIAGRVGNVPESVLADHDPMLDPLLSQAARFTGQCRVFAPLYRQITLGTFANPDADEYLERAYVDVEAAFAHYLAESGDRPFVIMGHSQGTAMTIRLIERVIAPDAALRARLIVALLIGGDLTVDGLDDVPMCASEDDVGCAIGYRAFAEGFPPPSPNASLGCVNPAAPTGGEGRFAGAFFPTSTHVEEFDPQVEWDPTITTPFVLFADLYAGECQEGYLEIRVRPEAGDMRNNPVPFDHALFSPNLLGLHVLDYNFPIADLVRVVQRKAEVHAG